MTTLETLIAARALIAHEQNWCQNYTSRMEHGNHQRCTFGAVAEAEPTEWEPAITALYEALPADCRAAGIFVSSNTAPVHFVIHYQDQFETKHRHVLALFDRAIERQRTIELMQSVPTFESESFAPAAVTA